MVIEEVRMRDFGRWDEARVSLRPGLNVLWGPNEAGKSTLLAAIFMLLFDKPTTTKTTATRWRRWGASRNYELAMTFRAQRRHWELVKDFEGQRSLLRDLDSRETWEDHSEAQRVLAALVGTDSSAIYQSTAGLRQQDILSLQEGRRLGELLQETVSGAADEVSVEQVLGRLEKVLSDLQRGTKGAPTRNLGEIASAEAHLAELQGREREVQGVVQRTTEAREQAARARVELEQLEEELADLQRLVAQAQERRSLEERREVLRDQALELQRRADRARIVKAQIERAEQELGELPEVTPEQALEVWRLQQIVEQATRQEQEAARLLPGLEEERAQVQARAEQAGPHTPYQQLLTEAVALQEELSRLGGEVEQRRAEATAADHAAHKERDRRSLRVVLLIVGLLFLVTGVAAGMLVNPTCFAATAPGLGLTVWGLALRPRARWVELLAALEAATSVVGQRETDLGKAVVQLRDTLERGGVTSLAELSSRAGEGSREALTLEKGLSQVEARRQTAEEQLEGGRREREQGEARLRDLLGELFTSPVQMQEIAQRRERLERDIESTRSEMEGILLESESQLEERLRALALDRGTLDQRLETEEMAAARMGPERLARLTGDLERKQARREALVHSLTEAEMLLRSAAYDAEDLAALREQVAQAAQRRDRLRRRERVLTIVLETLRQARQETLLAATDVLEPVIGELLGRLTLGRYGQISVNRETLEPLVFSPAKGARADQQTDLSLATREQVYLASRLALVKLLWPKEGPPLLLDDPLVNFDEARHEQACRLLAEFARERQVLLFTCSEPWAEFADCVVDLTKLQEDSVPGAG